LLTPAPTLSHQDFAGEIYRQLANSLEGQPCRVFIAPVDVRLPKEDEADGEIDTLVQPDVLVVCQADKLGRRGVRGAPDLVIEVLSPATAAHDHLRQRLVYERAGVREKRHRLKDRSQAKPDFRAWKINVLARRFWIS
jgi:Uma2 family endonuclease